MHGVQPRSLTNRELIRHCANKLETTITRESGLNYEEQVELLRRFVMVVNPEEGNARPVVQYRSTEKAAIDPDAD